MGKHRVMMSLDALVRFATMTLLFSLLRVRLRQSDQVFALLAAFVFGKRVLVSFRACSIIPDRLNMRLERLSVFGKRRFKLFDLGRRLIKLALPHVDIVFPERVFAGPLTVIAVHLRVIQYLRHGTPRFFLKSTFVDDQNVFFTIALKMTGANAECHCS